MGMQSLSQEHRIATMIVEEYNALNLTVLLGPTFLEVNVVRFAQVGNALRNLSVIFKNKIALMAVYLFHLDSYFELLAKLKRLFGSSNFNDSTN